LSQLAAEFVADIAVDRVADMGMELLAADRVAGKDIAAGGSSSREQLSPDRSDFVLSATCPHQTPTCRRDRFYRRRMIRRKIPAESEPN